MTRALHVEEEPESSNGNAAPNINHQLIPSLEQTPDCSRGEGLQLGVVVGMCHICSERVDVQLEDMV